MTLMFRGWGVQGIAWYCRVTGCWTRESKISRMETMLSRSQVLAREGTRPSRLNTEHPGSRDSRWPGGLVDESLSWTLGGLGLGGQVLALTLLPSWWYALRVALAFSYVSWRLHPGCTADLGVG